MSLQTVLLGAGRIILGMAIVAGSVPFLSVDAEARRARVNAVGAGSAAVRHYNRSSKENQPSEEGDKPQDGTADEAQQVEGTPIPRAQSATVAKPVAQSKPKDLEVPGCSTGMICVVCLAGCAGDVNVIVHAERRPEK